MIGRRGALAGAGAAAALARPALAQPARVLRMVPQANLGSLDPVWSTANVTRNHGFMIYDTLYGLTAALEPTPQMAAGHLVEDNGLRVTITLRDGLAFHDGEPVRAADAVASLRRWMARNPFGQKLATVVDELAADGDRRIVFRLSRPFPLLFNALAATSTPAFVMPERVAQTDPFKQIDSVVGSGPFRFKRDEFNSGSLVVYERNPAYQPAEGAPSLTAGGKAAHFGRVEWHIIPDAATASAALQQGEMDWFEQPPPELQTLLRRNRGVVVEAIDPLPLMGILRLNHLHPPFNDRTLRRALLPAIDQADFMTAIVGTEPGMVRERAGVFTPGTPYATEAGLEPLLSPRSLDAARAAMRDAGYTDQPMRLIGPTDILAPSAMTQVAADLFRRLGFNMDMVLSDWGTVIQRRANREPLSGGGWSALLTSFTSYDFLDPALHPLARGNGLQGWPGWPTIPRLEELRDAWFDAPDFAARKGICDDIQRTVVDEVAWVPVGGYQSMTALRRNLVGRVNGFAIFWACVQNRRHLARALLGFHADARPTPASGAMCMKRRDFLATAAAATGGLAMPSLAGAQDARVLRFLPQANLSTLDAVAGTQYVVRNASLLIWDTLFGVDSNLVPKPQMVEGYDLSDDKLTWTFKLRDGLRFHDGEPVLSRDVAASLNRWMVRDTMGQRIKASLAAMETVDDRTVRLRLTKPFPKMLFALGKNNAPVAEIMPERIAKTDPFQLITEYVGSGPMVFKKDEWVPGSKAVFKRFAGYNPRAEAGEWLSGGKRMMFDRIEWLILPDDATKAAALQNGEVDWWENPIPDLVPLLKRNRNVNVDIADPLGNIGSFRINHLHPPFNDPRVRRAVMMALSQEDYMRAVVGDDDALWKALPSFFTPGTPTWSDAGGELLTGPRRYEEAKKLLAEAGYKGEPVVLCVATDVQITKAQGDVTADLLGKIGMKVDYQALDWGTVGARRAKKDPPGAGGWNIFHTWHAGADCTNPAPYTALDAGGDKAWFGWPKSEAVQSAIATWYDAPDQAAEKAAMAAVNTASMENVTYIPTGFFLMYQAWRKNISGVVKAPFPVFWGVQKT